MRISDWSSGVCSSDLIGPSGQEPEHFFDGGFPEHTLRGEYRNFTVAEIKPEDFAIDRLGADAGTIEARVSMLEDPLHHLEILVFRVGHRNFLGAVYWEQSEQERRSEENTSELQSLMRISYAVFCLKKKNKAMNI